MVPYTTFPYVSDLTTLVLDVKFGTVHFDMQRVCAWYLSLGDEVGFQWMMTKKQDIWSTFTRHLLGFMVFKGHFRAFPIVTMWFYSGKEQREHNAKHLLVVSSWETKSQVWNDIDYDRVFIFGWYNNLNVLNQVGMYRDGSHDRSHEDTWPDWIMTLILIAVTNTQERWCTSMHKWVYGKWSERKEFLNAISMFLN